MATLETLAGRLPGYAKLRGDLRPSDAEIYRVVDQYRELGLCRLLREPGMLDAFQHLGWRKLGNPLWRALRFYWVRVPPPGLYLPGSRLPLGPAHVSSMHARRRMLETRLISLGHRGQAC